MSESTQNGLKRIKMQKKNSTPLTRFARCERSERRSATLPTPAVASLPRASRFALAFSVASLHRASRFALATYPMSLPGSQGVSMPSFISIGLKLWALEGYIQTDRHTHRQSFLYYIDVNLNNFHKTCLSLYSRNCSISVNLPN